MLVYDKYLMQNNRLHATFVHLIFERAAYHLCCRSNSPKRGQYHSNHASQGQQIIILALINYFLDMNIAISAHTCIINCVVMVISNIQCSF